MRKIKVNCFEYQEDQSYRREVVDRFNLIVN